MIHALDVAQTQIGIQEATGQNDGIPDERYGRGLKRGPWCALFVMWCFENSDDPNPHGSDKEWWRYGSVQNFEDGLKEKGYWMGWMIRPEPNDIVFFRNRGRSDPSPSGRHMGLVETVKNGRVHTIEGNTSDGVFRRDYPLESSRITGYGRMVDASFMSLEAFPP